MCQERDLLHEQVLVLETEVLSAKTHARIQSDRIESLQQQLNECEESVKRAQSQAVAPINLSQCEPTQPVTIIATQMGANVYLRIRETILCNTIKRYRGNPLGGPLH